MSVRSLARRLVEARVLPPHVGLFHARALLRASRLRDDFALASATRPADVALLLRLAAGRRMVAELGTATGWTTAALLLDDAHRRVVSFDPVVQAHRERYLALLSARARARLRLIHCPGVDGARHVNQPVDLLFIDSTHERDDTIAEVRAWRPALAPRALILLHDYDHPGFPGVREAVETLGLRGHGAGGFFVAVE